ncbi:MAG: hypothetical protein WBA11_02870 [Rubrivirga sp.]
MSCLVLKTASVVASAVDLEDKSGVGSEEVNDIRADGTLAEEPDAEGATA